MSSTRPTALPGAPSVRRHRARAAALLAAVALGLTLTACTSTEQPAVPAPTGASSVGVPAANALTIDVTIAGGDVTPNGQKLDVAVGQQVVLDVTSDADDEVHAHTGGDGYELEVKAGQPATGSFTLTSPGSFEVELHHLKKVVVILNAR
ncbi:hypothetical protein SAMN04488543_2567 [Friedmanniella luteola]|uniref:EfeO-type cupredoxin-like domain-containing protein n=1 Tax=Friedmanniella luteola TaxID=546871 RepID=A0A1H1VSK4_9ACTN|nr:hypothetical protein [Friedmanniella luteola]SDS87904.1 hypothetical protein SAMN04488543_2567 [Friedmanniella luteola]